MPSQQQQQQQATSGSAKKAVRFHESVRVKFHIHVQEFTDDEYFSCWYSDDESKTMRQDVKNQLHALHHGTLATVPRGLEARTREGSARKTKRKRMAWDAVMGEQEVQQEDGESDPEFIAALYSQACRHSLAQAHIRGRMDEQIVYGAPNNTDNTENSDKSGSSDFTITMKSSNSKSIVAPTKQIFQSLGRSSQGVRSILKMGGAGIDAVSPAPVPSAKSATRSKQRTLAGKAA
eukprot:CAMPEP_0198108202 /NCGR_PEP_ID=MMETSP1442-20131203/282_1 /TAXON_ID= /ORGANISM="Craspedostauros australis, Strain CCMP3328" /LENGTH=233 /DNA_ID=CAMNT_0043763431 /DNA_START=77 /DNA_END=778 /DNA_ORIENTATION=-